MVSSHMTTSLFSLPSGNFREDIFVRSAVISPLKRNVHLNDSRIVRSFIGEESTDQGISQASSN